MSKIEELTEILVNEIDGFEKGLEKMEILQHKIENTKINLNFQEIQNIKQELVREIAMSKNAQQKFLSSFEAKINKANIYPRWAVITFIVVFIVCFSSLFYSYTVKEKYSKVEKIGYEKGITNYKIYINEFFEKNPKSKQDFEKWQKIHE